MTSRIHFLNFKVTSELNYYVRTLHCLSRPCFLRIPLFDSPEVILNKISFFFLMTTPSFSSRSVCQPAQSSGSSWPQPRPSNRVQALILLPNTKLPHPFFNFKSTSCILSRFHPWETFVARSQHSVSSFWYSINVCLNYQHLPSQWVLILANEISAFLTEFSMIFSKWVWSSSILISPTPFSG